MGVGNTPEASVFYTVAERVFSLLQKSNALSWKAIIIEASIVCNRIVGHLRYLQTNR